MQGFPGLTGGLSQRQEFFLTCCEFPCILTLFSTYYGKSLQKIYITKSKDMLARHTIKNQGALFSPMENPERVSTRSRVLEKGPTNTGPQCFGQF